MKVNILSNKISWFGKYSGYECLPDYFSAGVEPVIHIAKYNLYNKVLGKYYKRQNKWNLRSEDVYNAIKFLRSASQSHVNHILYLEGHLHLIEKFAKKKNTLTGTVHLPVSQWGTSQLEKLSQIENIVLLYSEELETFGKYVDEDRIKVIKHGVDTDFFKPGSDSQVKKNKVLFVGHFLRNFEMTLMVYKLICKNLSSSIEFHFIIPSSFRNIPVLQTLASKNNVFFHEKLSDEELLEQYQSSYLLVMPMTDSGANTAIVQALSVGLPIITTDVGGIRSYGGGAVFPIIKNNDHTGMTELFCKYYFDEDYRNAIALNQRTYTLEQLDWKKIAAEHVRFYKNIVEPSVNMANTLA